MSGGTGRRAVEKIADALRDEILAGGLAAGEALREEHLATRFDASRHTVRSALGMLAAERLVTAEPYRGVRVTRLDDRQVGDLQQLRAAIECEVVRGFGDLDVAEVEARIEELGRLEQANAAWLEVERAHAAVHQALVDAAGNARLSEVYRGLESELALLLLHARDTFTGRDLAVEHRAWLRDLGARGERAVREHLDASTRDLLALRSSD